MTAPHSSVTLPGPMHFTRLPSPAKARTALELLVAQARIDGQISDEERSLLVRIAGSLKITGEDFSAVYEAGIRRADEIRRSRPDPA